MVVPVVLPLVAWLLTVTSHSAVWPCVKVPVWVLLTESTGEGLIVIVSVPEVGVMPAPLTLALLFTEAGAFVATFTLSVRVG